MTAAQSPSERVLRAAPRLKVFPLPQVVLFPGTSLPLHIFEPRYRQMVADALATDGVIAMARAEPTQLQPRPALEPMLCAGVITQSEALPDGRYNLVLEGVARALLVREHPQTRPWREVEAQVLPDPAVQGPQVHQLRQAVVELAARVPDEAAVELARLGRQAKDGGALADVLASALVQDPKRRQALLAETRVEVRLDRMLGEVGSLLAQVAPGRTPAGPRN